MMKFVQRMADRMSACGLPHTPPINLLTRWGALLAEEEELFLDAAWDSGEDVPGSRYTFLAITAGAICYLQAEHDDPWWSFDSMRPDAAPGRSDPRSLVSWRRPLTAVSKVSLGGDPFTWLPPTHEGAPAPTPVYVLHLDGDVVQLPLVGRWRESTPDPLRVIHILTSL